jgi:proteasome lid subunit RPN8/RPN11
VKVNRRKPLLERAARGLLIVPQDVMSTTQLALQRSRGADGEKHEGLVFFLGRIVEGDSVAVAAVSPDSEHSWGRVIADESAMAAVAAYGRRFGLGVIAQVHSHPGSDTRHSDGDDQLVFMPFEGMFSLVVGDYGFGEMTPSLGLGLHQFQDGRWVAIDRSKSALLVVPSMVEL